MEKLRRITNTAEFIYFTLVSAPMSKVGFANQIYYMNDLLGLYFFCSQ